MGLPKKLKGTKQAYAALPMVEKLTKKHPHLMPWKDAIEGQASAFKLEKLINGRMKKQPEPMPSGFEMYARQRQRELLIQDIDALMAPGAVDGMIKIINRGIGKHPAKGDIIKHAMQRKTFLKYWEEASSTNHPTKLADLIKRIKRINTEDMRYLLQFVENKKKRVEGFRRR
ncbi:MAG: hypothetical protein ABH854_02635 [Candidatus Diapherotrites archaeon]|nr:hypothetical protein [Candidatus Micrarchaeota archaeon]MBU1940094.1 hypothetical protein [Candidatus Micrarchaeota archaeon]